MLFRSKRIYQKGFIVASDGNVSVRLDKERIMITPSGLNKGFLKGDELIVVDFSGKVITGSYKPSSETPMHLEAYKQREDINAVIHAHPPIATAFSIANVSLAQCILPEVILSLGAIPTTQYATPATYEGSEIIRELVTKFDAMVLDRHGSLTVGKTLEDAYNKLERVEHSAYITYMARQLGGANPLPVAEVNRLSDMAVKLGLKPEAATGCLKCGACNRKGGGRENKGSNENKEAFLSNIADEVVREIRKTC